MIDAAGAKVPIIDAHGHLGDILHPDGGRLIDRRDVPPPPRQDVIAAAEARLYRDALGLGRFVYPLLGRAITRAERARNASASLEHFQRSLDESGISRAVCLPIPPYVRFEDLARAALREPRIIAFTGVDYTGSDAETEGSGGLDGFASHLGGDVAAGARGLKLHPIIQKVPLDDPRTRVAVETFAPHGLPVLVHSGISSYYLGRDRAREEPRFGAVADFARLVRDFPRVPFVAGHAGLMQVKELMGRLRGVPNVWVDTSFQSVKRVRQLIDCFGPERVLFASDWPYGYRPPALSIVREVCRGDAGLERRLLCENAAELLKLA